MELGREKKIPQDGQDEAQNRQDAAQDGQDEAQGGQDGTPDSHDKSQGAPNDFFAKINFMQDSENGLKK